MAAPNRSANSIVDFLASRPLSLINFESQNIYKYIQPRSVPSNNSRCKTSHGPRRDFQILDRIFLPVFNGIPLFDVVLEAHPFASIPSHILFHGTRVVPGSSLPHYVCPGNALPEATVEFSRRGSASLPLPRVPAVAGARSPSSFKNGNQHNQHIKPHVFCNSSDSRWVGSSFADTFCREIQETLQVALETSF